MVTSLVVALFGLVLLVFSAFRSFAVDGIKLSLSVEEAFDEALRDERSKVGFLVLRAVSIFVIAFGVVGALGRYFSLGVGLSLLAGVLAGAAIAGVYLFAVRLVRLREKRLLLKFKSSCLVGRVGWAADTIRPGRVGMMRCSIPQDLTVHLKALPVGEQEIPEGVLVRIADVAGEIVFVKRVDPGELQYGNVAIPRVVF